jgi:hypothetical protein
MSALGELAGIYAGFSACPPSANSGHRIACRYIPFENPDAAILFFGPHQDLPQVQLRGISPTSSSSGVMTSGRGMSVRIRMA